MKSASLSASGAMAIDTGAASMSGCGIATLNSGWISVHAEPLSAAMNMASYATVLGKDIDNDQFKKQFMDYFEIMVQIETALLASYENALEDLE